MRVICADCGADMQLIKSARRNFWGCTRFPECKGMHSAHQRTGQPLGRPANAETRTARKRVHRMFDRLWKEGGLTRQQAYIWLQREMKMDKRDAHIGMFTLRDCQVLMEVLRRAKKQGMFKRKSKV